MKKMLLGLIVLGTVLSTSCSKDSEVTPDKKESLPYTMQSGPKKKLGDYD